MLAAITLVAGCGLWPVRAERPGGSPVRAAPPATATLRQTFETFADPPDVAALRFYGDNTQAWTERWRLLQSAQHAIDVSYFLLHEDVFGLAFLGHLLERAQAGVSVRVLLDAYGTRMLREIGGNDHLEELAATRGVTVRKYRPLWRRWTEGLLTLRASAIMASEHDKILVIDRSRSLIGGRNIAAEYFEQPAPGNRAFRDADLRIDSPRIAEALTGAFERQFESEDAVPASDWDSGSEVRRELLHAYEAMDQWLHGTEATPVESGTEPPWLRELRSYPQLFGALQSPPPRPVRGETRILDSHTRRTAAADPITDAVLRLVQTAEREVFVQTPYVVLSEDGVQALEEASARGVAITIVTNSPVSSDNALSQAFFLEQWPEIMARVPTLRLIVAGGRHNLHTKGITFDGVLTMLGTYNLDPVSMRLNSEVMAVTWSGELAALVEEQARSLIARGEPEVFEYRIQRDADGRAMRDDDGEVRIAYGPRDHCTPEEWTALAAYWAVLKAARTFVGFSPIL
ncbi:MAG TPA: phosphatidylserine/phosphatidylglycerophosphate/cardiolipin synthase family protein [Candidatus Limnocylindrales bacterium]|nr:phosphatidylserine/phosphatidylglycerophosphate/cardiolipin synthase family protein [Candidatus Limnocylindrales bacterium]